MPRYEYQTKGKGCKLCKDRFEIIQSILDEPIKICPECNNAVEKLVSLPSGFIVKGRQANQYSDIKYAKYWRDADGNRHKVTPSDGSLNSPTVSRKRKRSDEDVKKIIKERAIRDKKKRSQASYKDFCKKMKRY